MSTVEANKDGCIEKHNEAVQNLKGFIEAWQAIPLNAANEDAISLMHEKVVDGIVEYMVSFYLAFPGRNIASPDSDLMALGLSQHLADSFLRSASTTMAQRIAQGRTSHRISSPATSYSMMHQTKKDIGTVVPEVEGE